MSERAERCETCKFWEGYTGDVEHGNEPTRGNCHRYPPRHYPNPDSETLEDQYDFPAVETDDWCGEWQAITLAAVQE